MPRMRFPLLAVVLAILAGASSTRAQDDVGQAAARASASAVRPGDQINLRFPREPELTGSYTVNERGEAVFPKLGILDVGEMSIAGLRDSLHTRYSEFLRLPEFEITVLRRILVNGEVRAPNVYLVDISTTLRDVIARAGGISDAGNRGKVYLVRGGERIKVDRWDSLTAGDTDLRSGDQVFVGRKSWWTMNALPAVSTAVLVASLIISVSR